MEIPNHYLIFAAEVFSTTLLLLIALIYFYIKSNRKWQLHIHDIQDELLAFRNKYLNEKERADTIRELLQNKSAELEKANLELAEFKNKGEKYLAEIAKLKAEIGDLKQSEKLRSEIVNQLVKSKIQIERLTAELAANQKSSAELNDTISNLENEINILNDQLQSANDQLQITTTSSTEETGEQSYNLQTNGEMSFDRLQARADKQEETIRNLELELMRVAYKKPSEQSENNVSDDTSQIHDLERMLNESETCVKLLESELTELQNRIRTLEEEAQDNPQNSDDIQKLEQMLKESETCNTLLETELESLMQKIRILEGKEEPPKPPPPNYDI